MKKEVDSFEEYITQFTNFSNKYQVVIAFHFVTKAFHMVKSWARIIDVIKDDGKRFQFVGEEINVLRKHLIRN